MKLVIMIPCLNEAETLPLVFKTMPRKIAGIDEIEILVIDDGSTDNTIEVAKSLGVKQFVHHTRNQGLSRSFRDGLNRALELGADIIVLTDGDNQYPQDKIPELIQPILDGKADTVIADRHTQNVEYFSPFHKFLQRAGTWVLNLAAGTNIPDATSGFRAYSRKAAMQLNVIADYSFATETTIQASHKRHAIATISIQTNPKLRPSRQFKHPWEHARRSSVTIVRGFVMYRPYAFFFGIGLILFIAGLIPFIHYAYVVWTARPAQAFGAHHLQSLIVGTVLLTASFISFMLGVVADLIRVNRIMLEDVLSRLRQQDSERAYQSPQLKNHSEVE